MTKSAEASEVLISCYSCGQPPLLVIHERLALQGGAGTIKNKSPYLMHCANDDCERMPVGDFCKTEQRAIEKWNIKMAEDREDEDE